MQLDGRRSGWIAQTAGAVRVPNRDGDEVLQIDEQSGAVAPVVTDLGGGKLRDGLVSGDHLYLNQDNVSGSRLLRWPLKGGEVSEPLASQRRTWTKLLALTAFEDTLVLLTDQGLFKLNARQPDEAQLLTTPTRLISRGGSRRAVRVK